MDIRTLITPPLHQLPFFKNCNKRNDFPVSNSYCDSILSLPNFSFDSDRPVIDEYIKTFKKIASIYN